MPKEIDNPNIHETEIRASNPVDLLATNIADSVTNITAPTEAKIFTIKGRSFSVEEYVQNILVPLTENKQRLMEAFNAIPSTFR